ncbi:MAG: hypothetical protein ACJAUZ_001603 [Flavobacteriaceae bacterium]|jgi:hypothetical protein
MPPRPDLLQTIHCEFLFLLHFYHRIDRVTA